MKKILVSDFDETLCYDGYISKENENAIINFQKENIFVIATGSSYTSFKRKCENSNLNYNYLIVNHGSTIFKNNEIVSNYLIDKNILTEIIQRYNLNNKNNYTTLKDENANFFSSATQGLVDYDNEYITKIHLEFNEDDYKKEVDYLKEKYKEELNIYELNYNNDIEIISKQASKLNAIKKIMKLENIPDDNIYCIGDGESDLEMIKSYKGYAIKNALDIVKENSIKVVGDVTQLIDIIEKE